MSITGFCPYLKYEDAGSAMDWLERVFGFEDRARYVDKDGIVRQGEMAAGSQEIWFSGHGPGFWEELGVANTMWIGVWVDDVDAMHAQVVAAGIDADPPEDKDYDVRTFSVKDPEGYSWGFMKRLGIEYKQTVPTEAGGLEEVRGPGFRV